MAESLKRLVGPRALTNTNPGGTTGFPNSGGDMSNYSGSTLYTAPTGTTTVIRHMQITNPASGAADLWMLFGSSSADSVLNRFPMPFNALAAGSLLGTVGSYYVWAASMPSGQMWHWADTLALNPGESIWAVHRFTTAITASATNSVYITVHGVEISS